jgi:FkbM family methyltransferase
MVELKLGSIWYPVTDNNGNPIDPNTLYISAIYKELYWDGIYNDVLNRTGMTIIDIGANIGIITAHMRQYADKVYAIEPSPEHFAALQKNKEFYGWDNVELFNEAVADHDGEMFLAFEGSNRTCNSITNNYGQGGVTVKIVAMDTFFEENGIKEVDFLKVDVEGADDLILRSEGFTKVAPKIKALEVEFHHDTWPSLVAYVVSLGFTATRLESNAIIVLFTRNA